MKFLNLFGISINKALSTSLTIYNNNTRLIRNKTKSWEKKFLSEFKEYAFEVVSFLETRKGFWLKWFLVSLLIHHPLQRLYYIFGGKKEKMLQGGVIMQTVALHETDNIEMAPFDKHNKRKIMSSYWINYT